MTTELVSSFTNGEPGEFAAIQAGSVDLTDWPMKPSQISGSSTTPGCATSTVFTCTFGVPDHGYFEVQFDQTNNFWGCKFQFGNSACGLDFRQGIAHLVDRAIFATNSFLFKANPVDDPLAACTVTAGCSNGGLPAANPCAWDPRFAQSVSCEAGAPGGTSYHLNSPTQTGGTGTLFAWQPNLASPDFCAAATHFQNAFTSAGLTGVTQTSSCVLLAPGQTTPGVGWPTILPNGNTFQIVQMLGRTSEPRKDLSESIAQEICALFTGSLTTQCSPFLSQIEVPITGVCAFTTSGTGTPNNCWWIYTGGFGQVFPFDSSLYFTYNSLFVSKTTDPAFPNSCASSAFSTSASNYLYICSTTYDSLSTSMEFANSVNVATCVSGGTGIDPTLGSILTPASAFNGSCNGKLDALSAGYQAEDFYGSHAYTIPMWAGTDVFSRLNNWPQGGSTPGIAAAIGSSFEGLANFFNWLDAYSATPSSPGVIRQAFMETTDTLNPFQSTTLWDFFILANIYDSLYETNPECSQVPPTGSGQTACSSALQIIDWMTTSHSFINCPGGACSVGHTVAPGTNVVLRNNLRNNLHWQDGLPVTAYDVKWTYLNLNATGAFQASPLSNVKGIHVVSATQLDLELGATGPFTEFFIGGITVMPGHLWSACGATTWNSEVNSAGSNTALVDNCIGTFAHPNIGSVGGVSFSDPRFDPIVHDMLTGSSGWTCQNTGADIGTPVGTIGTGCSSNDTDAPPLGSTGAFTLTRTGCTLPGPTCVAPAFPGDYFHSSGNLALYAWTGNTGSAGADIANLSTILNPACLFHAPTTGGCARFTQGIGNSSPVASGAGACPCTITFTQVSTVNQLRTSSFIAPFTSDSSGWNPSLVPGIGTPYPPTLYQVGATPSTLAPASSALCSTAPYPFGNGYDC